MSSDSEVESSPVACPEVEEFVGASKPRARPETEEYFSSRSNPRAERSETPPYTCWKNENVHLFSHDLQSSFGRKLQNNKELVYPPLDDLRRKKSPRAVVSDSGESPAFHPPPDLRKPLRTRSRDESSHGCGCNSPPLIKKHPVSSHTSPYHLLSESHVNFQPPPAFHHDSLGFHCCCTPAGAHHRRVENPVPERRKSRERKDANVDLYRIVLLQNQQLGELRNEVKRLTEEVHAMQKDALDKKTVKDCRKSRVSSTGVQTYCEEKLSVGVMTSIVQVSNNRKSDSLEESSSSGDAATTSSSSAHDRQQKRSKRQIPASDLQSRDIPAIVARQSSPPASIHIEMPEYDSPEYSASSSCSSSTDSDSDENSDSEDVPRNGRAPAIGWTYYDAVVGKVNELLSEGQTPQHLDHNVIKQATLDHLMSIGVSFAELDLQQTNKRVTFDNKQLPIPKSDETDTSMRLNALALKYLKEDQSLKPNVPKPRPHFQANTQAPSNTNFSFATMRYLERHHLTPGPIKPQVAPQTKKPHGTEHSRQKDKRKTYSKKKSQLGRKQERCSSDRKQDRQINKILDITAIKNQPKLLPKRF